MSLSKFCRTLVGILTVGALLGTFAATPSAPAKAEYPSKTILTIVPFGAGGGTDRWARVMSSVGFDVFKGGMRIQNRGGASGTIGWKYMMDRGADGHTVILASTTPMIAALIEKNPPFDPANVKLVAYYSIFRPTLMAPKGKSYKDWNSFLDYVKTAKKKPSVGGTISLLIGLINLLDQKGLADRVIPVTYSGTGKTMNDYLGGHIDLALVTTSTAITILDKSVAIVNGTNRPYVGKAKKLLSGVPNAGTLGMEPFNPPRFVAMHPDTPDEQVKIMSKKFGELLKMKPVKKLMAKLGEEIVFLPHDEGRKEYDKILASSRKFLKLLK